MRPPEKPSRAEARRGGRSPPGSTNAVSRDLRGPLGRGHRLALALGLAALVLATTAGPPSGPRPRLAGAPLSVEAQTAQPGARQPAQPRRKRSRPARDESYQKPAAAAATAAPEVPVVEEPRADAERRARAQGSIVVPRSGSAPTVRIPLADGLPGRLARGELPLAWDLKRFAGRAQFELVREEGRAVFRLASEASSFALHRDVAVDLEQFPILTWWWKVTRLPARGDLRARETDDQAAQVYLVFPRSPSPRTSSDVLGYVWDSHAPAGLRATNPRWSNVRVIVLESGERRAGAWVREERDVRRDYIDLFGKTPPTLGKVALMTDSDQTRSQSEAFFDELRFRRAGASSTSQPGRPN